MGAFLARGISVSEAAIAGAYLHGSAGDLAMLPTGGGIAGDLVDALPLACAKICKANEDCESLPYY
jgi:NAD(P)H-hydrate repair Nnr-like enzyme with NAD(P)H-hydrate dehydratase domain